MRQPVDSHKWCGYCLKTDHSDWECWCTRVASNTVKPSYVLSAVLIPPLLRSPVNQAADQLLQQLYCE